MSIFGKLFGKKTKIDSSRINEIQKLIELLKDYGNENERGDAAKKLMAIGPSDSEAIPLLIKEMKAKSSFIRQAAAHALRNIGKAAVPALIELLKYEQQDVNGETAITEFCRIGIAWTLGEIGRDAESAIAALLEATKNMDIDVYREIESALKKIYTPTSIPIFIKYLKHEDSLVIQMASEVLSGITGQGFGCDQKKWQEWCEKNKGKYDPCSHFTLLTLFLY